MNRNRVLDSLKKSLDKGNNLIFLYGSGVKDKFLYNFYYGSLNLNQTLKLYFWEREDIDLYCYINNKIKCYKRTDKKFQQVANDFFSTEQDEDDFGDVDEKENSKTEEGREVEEKLKNSGVEFENNFTILKEKISVMQEKVVVFFENFEWTAGLYSSNEDAALKYIKKIKELELIKNVIIIISLEDIEMIKEYNFEISRSNSLYIGNPSSDEIKTVYLRKYFKEYTGRQAIQTNIISELEDVSQAMSSSNNSLRAAMRIYENVVNKTNKIDKKDFEIAIEKILDEKVYLSDVILDEQVKESIVLAVDNFIKSDSKKLARKGLILTGPPGTGKTHIVKAIANEKNCFFIAPTLSDLKGEFVGQTSIKVRKLFEQARANQPAIIFIDEADTIFPDRNIGGNNSDSFNLDMVNEFLVQIDGMTTGTQKIFVIAATNRISILDSAIKSRLSEVINIGLPDKIKRKEIFANKLLKYNFLFKEKSFSDEIADKTENMSGRDIDNFVKKLNEVVSKTKYRNISNLKDDKNTRKIFMDILKSTENTLIDELVRKVPVEIIKPNNIDVNFSDIIGYSNIKESINRQINSIYSSHKKKMMAEYLGIKSKKGILLYGPPGNAKSMLAKATAREHNLYYIKVLSKDFASVNFETQLNNLEMIFEYTIRLSKMCTDINGVLLFFDEFDALASKAILNSVIRGTLLDYLSNDTDGIRSENSKVLFMAATNFYGSLDEALIRKGRIDEHIFMNNPEQKQGIEIMKNTFEQDNNIEKIQDNLVEKIYENLVEKIKQKVVKIEKEKLMEQSFYSFDEEKINEVINKKYKDITPSGAEILDLCKEIKEEAFYLKKIRNKKLYIDEDVLKNVLDI
ncbi:MAG: AAA family ATPase [Clostridium sp.]